MATENKRGGAGRGQGRKPGNPEERTKLRPVYLTDRQWDHCFREVNSSTETGASEYIRRLVEADMKKRALQEQALEESGAVS